MICTANWIVVSLWETVACYLLRNRHLISSVAHEAPKTFIYFIKTSHFKTPTLALPKFQNKKICKSYSFNHRHQDKSPPCLGFPWRPPSSGPHPAPKRSYRPIRGLFGEGIPLKTSVGLKKTPSWTNHRCSVGCWDSMISLYIYIYICLSTTYTSWFEEIFRMVVRDISPFSIRTPVKFRHSSQPGFPVLQPSSPWNSGLFGELGAKVQLTGKCRFWLSEMLG